jgi:nicotinamide-nucleotide amidase
MQAEILMIGTELLLGQIEDTNATYMARVLADNGINLYQKTTIGDNTERIVDALDAALRRSDVVLCSGGLGPTEDDLTRDCVAEVMGKPLEYHPEIYAHIETMFARSGYTITENNKKQAFAPEGALIVENPNGTAPGLIVEGEKGIIVCMPGVPHELYAMLNDSVLPFLRERFDLRAVIHYRVLKVCGYGESRVDAAMGDLMSSSENPKIGVLANPAHVRIRISALADTVAEANALIDPVDAAVRERLPGLVMGTDDDTIESVVEALFAERGWTLAVAESSSGGMICQRLLGAGAVCLAGGRVYPLDAAATVDAKEAGLDWARRSMSEWSASCGLAVVSDLRNRSTVIVFVCPDGEADWEIGQTRRDEHMQLRTSVTALEHVRRFLVN